MKKLRIGGWLAFTMVCAAMVADCARLTISELMSTTGTPESLQSAIKVWPYRADPYRYLAVLEPDSSDSWFGQSLARNARDTRTWLRMGLQAESDGKMEAAERFLIEATRLDKTYEPRWTLCNFYFRRGDTVKFWQWAREAASVGRDDLTPLFDLSWQVRGDTEAIMKEIVPDNCLSHRRFFSYLQGLGEPAQAALVAPELLSCPDDESRRMVAQFTTTLLLNGRPAEAVSLWNGLIAAKGLPFPEVDASKGHVLSNGDFGLLPSNRGFDWHFDPTPGLTLSQAVGGKGLRLTFDGSEPDAFAVIYQPVPLQSNATYQLSMELSSPLHAVPEGFCWRLVDLRSGKAVAPDGDDLAGASGRRGWRFRSSSVPVQALALIYQRPTGRTRFQGEIDLQGVELAGQGLRP